MRIRLARLSHGSLEYSNGQVERHIPQLKLIHRSMYGHSGFDLLLHRVVSAAQDDGGDGIYYARMDSVLDFIDDYQRCHGTRAAFIKGRAFMIAYFALIRRSLPPVAQDALRVAQRYLADEAAATDLTAARVACWQYLDARHLTYAHPQPPEASAVRAAICFLWADPTDDDPGMGVDFFLSLANAVKDHSSQTDDLIAAIFQ